MNQITSSRRIALGIPAIATLSIFGTLLIGNARPVNAAPVSSEALLYSTMPSTFAHRPEMVMDGDPNTYFKSVYNMEDGDDFRILFSQPVPLQSIRIVTGDAENQD